MFTDDIRNLYELQKVDTRLKDIENSKEGLPETVNQIQADLDERLTRYSELAQENKDIEVEKTNLQGKIITFDSDMKKYQEQRKVVTTNKEYEALVAQINFTKDQIEYSENKIEEYEFTLIGNQEEMEQINEDKIEIEENLQDNQALLNQKLSETEQEEKQLVDAQKEYISKLPPRVYILYAKIKGSKGIAVVNGEKGYCEGCHTMLPWQKISELKRQNQIVQCEACSRILTYGIHDLKEEDSE